MCGNRLGKYSGRILQSLESISTSACGKARCMNMSDHAVLQAKERGRVVVIGTLKGLIGRLEEKREEFGTIKAPTLDFDRLNLHSRIKDVARDLFVDWDAVFAASKA